MPTLWTSISVPSNCLICLGWFCEQRKGQERKAIHSYLIAFHCSSRIRRITGKSTWQSPYSSFRPAWSCHILLLGNAWKLGKALDWNRHKAVQKFRMGSASIRTKSQAQTMQQGLQMASIPCRRAAGCSPGTYSVEAWGHQKCARHHCLRTRCPAIGCHLNPRAKGICHAFGWFATSTITEITTLIAAIILSSSAFSTNRLELDFRRGETPWLEREAPRPIQGPSGLLWHRCGLEPMSG